MARHLDRLVPTRTRRRLLGLLVLGGVALLGTVTLRPPAATRAAPVAGLPASCGAFYQRYFQSGLPNGDVASFTLVSDGSTTVGTYATGDLTLNHVFGGGTGLLGSGEQFFSDRTWTEPGLFTSHHPFSPYATDPLGVSILGPDPRLRGSSFGVVLRPKSNTPLAMTAQGCVGDNVLYGTLSDGAVVLSLGPLHPAAPPPPR